MIPHNYQYIDGVQTNEKSHTLFSPSGTAHSDTGTHISLQVCSCHSCHTAVRATRLRLVWKTWVGTYISGPSFWNFPHYCIFPFWFLSSDCCPGCKVRQATICIPFNGHACLCLFPWKRHVWPAFRVTWRVTCYTLRSSTWKPGSCSSFHAYIVSNTALNWQLGSLSQTFQKVQSFILHEIWLAHILIR